MDFLGRKARRSPNTDKPNGKCLIYMIFTALRFESANIQKDGGLSMRSVSGSQGFRDSEHSDVVPIFVDIEFKHTLRWV